MLICYSISRNLRSGKDYFVWSFLTPLTQTWLIPGTLTDYRQLKKKKKKEWEDATHGVCRIVSSKCGNKDWLPLSPELNSEEANAQMKASEPLVWFHLIYFVWREAFDKSIDVQTFLLSHHQCLLGYWNSNPVDGMPQLIVSKYILTVHCMENAP